MGAALTYARRYALFTLVGIAGEDDLDAPDLAVQTVEPSPKTGPPATETGSNGLRPPPARQNRSRSLARARPASRPPSCRVKPRQSSGTSCWPSWKGWSSRTISTPGHFGVAKGKHPDAGGWGQGQSGVSSPARPPPDRHRMRTSSPAERDQPAANEEIRSRIDKSVLALPEARRLRDKTHLRFVAKQPCLVCGRQPCDPAPSAVCAIARSRTQGQRRIHGPAVPGTPSRTAPHRQGNGLVGESRSRAHQPGAQALAGNPPAPRFC